MDIGQHGRVKLTNISATQDVLNISLTFPSSHWQSFSCSGRSQPITRIGMVQCVHPGGLLPPCPLANCPCASGQPTLLATLGEGTLWTKEDITNSTLCPKTLFPTPNLPECLLVLYDMDCFS